MNDSMKARPTEYKGVRFRSKSEAVFARCLDLSNKFSWEYEPPYQSPMEIHPWDFYLESTGGKRPWVSADDLFIEYKPVKPTETYVCDLVSKVESWPDLSWTEENESPLNVAIVYGSPWKPACPGSTYVLTPIRLYGGTNGPRRSDWIGDKDGFGVFASYALGITESIVTKAKRYRFDLQH